MVPDRDDPTVVQGPWSPAVPDQPDQMEPVSLAKGDIDIRPAGHLAEPESEYARTGWGRITGALPRIPYRASDELVVDPLPIRTGRATARTLFRVARGHTVLARRAVDAGTHAPTREQIRVARAAGNSEALAEWLDRHQLHKTARWNRLAALPQVLAGLAVAVLGGVAAVGVVTGLGGLVVAMTHPAGWTWGRYWHLFGQVISVVATLGVYALQVGLYGAVPAWLYATWRAGDDVIPTWLASPAQRADLEGAPITPSSVVTALRDLGIATLRNAVRDMGDAGAGMLGPITIAGCGVEVDAYLPSGVSTAEIQARGRKLAENLGRHEHEVFISIPRAARTVRLWIADPGALDEPVGTSPLVIDHDLTADYYTGRAPWGPDLRGDAVLVSLKQRHVLVTGLSNQGKTAAVRALALWLALDPTVELWIADLKGIGDWSMFEGLATRLIEGPTDEHVALVTEMLEDAVVEMERRNEAVRRSGSAKGVTRDMARAGTGLHPLVAIVDEAQVAFMCPAVDEYRAPYGGTKATSRYFMAARKLHNQGRAVNVTLWQGTQDPTDQNLPKLVREGAHLRASLAVGTEAQGRMALGDKAMDGGAAPHKLRQGIDKGVLEVAGDAAPLAAGQSSIRVRTHFIDGDEATEVAARAKARRALVVTRRTTPVAELEPVDHLADIAAAMREERRVRTTVVLGRLAQANRSYYERWTSTDLAAALKDHKIEIKKSDGQSVLRIEDIHGALANREGSTWED